MNGLPYYKRYPRDFIEGTIGMSFELKAAYSLVLDLIYMQDGKLPDDERYISGLLSVSIRKWKSLRNELIERGKIYINGEFLSNKRADNLLETSRKLQDKNAENGAKSNKNNNIDKANAQLTRGLNTESDTNKDTNVSIINSPEPEKSGPVCVILLTNTGDEFSIFESELPEWEKTYPAVDVRQQLLAMRQWLIANPTRRKTKRGMRKFVVSWLDRMQNRGPVKANQGAPPSQAVQHQQAINEELRRIRENDASSNEIRNQSSTGRVVELTAITSRNRT